MLDLIRKKQKSIIIKVVFWTIIAAFVGTIFLVWGKGRNQGERGEAIAARVNGTVISYGEYQAAYDNLVRLYQNIYRDQFTPAMESQLRLKDQALETLIEQTLLGQEARSRKIKVSQKELVEAISQIPAFQEDGVFNKDRYLAVLNYQRITPEDFEAAQRRELRIDKLKKELQGQVAVTDEEIEEDYLRQNEKVNLSVLKFVPAAFESKVEVSEEDLQAFFTEHQEEFRLPETRALRYLQFDPARYEDEVTMTEEDLEKYHRRHPDQFETPEQVKAAHILIRVSADADQATRTKKRKLAEKVLAQAKEGKDFATLARTYSDDPGSAAKGGDLGYFGRGGMVKPFEKAVFAMKPGEISDLVETQFGFHIIKLQEHTEAGVKTLAEVTDQVRAEVRAEKARELATDKAWQTYSEYRQGGDLEAAARALDMGVKETGFFDRGGVIDGFGRSPDLTAAAFALKEGELSRPVTRPEGTFLFIVREVRESRVPELSKVRKKAEEDFRREKAKDLAGEAAQQALAELKNGQKPAKVAKKLGGTVEETGLFSRSYGAFIPRVGSSEELAEQAFALTRENPVAPQTYLVGGNHVVVALKERQEADPAALDETHRQELRDNLLSKKKDEALQQKVQDLRSQADIEIRVAQERGLKP